MQTTINPHYHAAFFSLPQDLSTTIVSSLEEKDRCQFSATCKKLRYETITREFDRSEVIKFLDAISSNEERDNLMLHNKQLAKVAAIAITQGWEIHPHVELTDNIRVLTKYLKLSENEAQHAIYKAKAFEFLKSPVNHTAQIERTCLVAKALESSDPSTSRGLFLSAFKAVTSSSLSVNPLVLYGLVRTFAVNEPKKAWKIAQKIDDKERAKLDAYSFLAKKCKKISIIEKSSKELFKICQTVNLQLTLSAAQNPTLPWKKASRLCDRVKTLDVQTVDEKALMLRKWYKVHVCHKQPTLEIIDSLKEQLPLVQNASTLAKVGKTLRQDFSSFSLDWYKRAYQTIILKFSLENTLLLAKMARYFAESSPLLVDLMFKKVAQTKGPERVRAQWMMIAQLSN